MNYQKKFWVSIYNSFRDRGGGLVSPPPQSIKVQIGARSVRVKVSKNISIHFDNNKRIMLKIDILNNCPFLKIEGNSKF